ncbi:hypothetical protein PFISCL1PPCAC_26339, partial [Pristionchus fissidentatus]
DDFYHHVCSQKADPEEFLMKKIGRILSEPAEKLQQNATRNNAIMVDIRRMRENLPEDNNYSALSKLRLRETKVNHTVISSAYSQEQIISKYISDTSKIIDAIIPEANFTSVYILYPSLISRIHAIEFLESSNTYGDFHYIKDIAENMKSIMIKTVNESKWLHSDDISEFINGKIRERIENIKIYQDFDHLDRNL